ncbi:type VI secretion system protein TssA, partial [Singulisphaera rosea]
MSTPTVLDVEDALTPIPGDNPSGENLAYEPAYDELREARRSEDDTAQGDWQRKAKTADWERVIELGMELLKRKTKDLQIAAWITEGLGKRHKFAGLRDGFRLLRELQEAFWETCYPEIDDGDLESRGSPYELLNRVLPTMIRSVPMTSGFGEEQYSYYRYQESRATDNVGLKNPELMETLISEGKITSRQFDEAVSQSPRRFYEALAEDLKECAESLKALDDSLDQRFGRQSPGLSHIRKAIEDCRVLLGPILTAKRAAEPDPADEESSPAEEAESETYES